VLAKCREPEAILGLSLAGGSLALAAALSVPAEWSTPGHKAAFNAGTLWGVYHAGLFLSITDQKDDQTSALTLIGGQLAGSLLGHMVWRETRPSEGQVSLVNTFAIWSPALASLALATIAPDVHEDTAQTVALVATDAGILAGSYLASTLPAISRGRTLLIDAGALVGGLGGAGIALIIGGDSVDEQVGFSMTLLGTATGLGLAAYFSRGWDIPDAPDARLTLMPNRDGGLSAGVMVELD
jgi:hypothetical protein